jgi:hypothetical protein
VPTERDGRRIATLFRRARNLHETRACDLEALLDEDGIEIVESVYPEAAFTGCLLRIDGGAGIMLAKGLSSGRRRFTLAHELGHFCIPSHAQSGSTCNEADLRDIDSDSKRREAEANDFAAELLMPWKLFAEDVKRLEISVSSVERLAGPEMYQVSQLAAAWRVMQTTRERAALVVSTGGAVEWAVKSDPCGLWLPSYGTRLNGNSVAASVLRGEGAPTRPVEVPVAAWHESVRPSRGRLLESCYVIEQTGQVVSLLWQVESDSFDDDA